MDAADVVRIEVGNVGLDMLRTASPSEKKLLYEVFFKELRKLPPTSRVVVDFASVMTALEPDNIEPALAAGAAETLVVLLRGIGPDHVDVAVVEKTCDALVHLVDDDSKWALRAERIGAAGIISALHAVAKPLLNDATAAHRLMFTWNLLIGNWPEVCSANLRLAFSAGVVADALTAMRVHANDKIVQGNGAVLLKHVMLGGAAGCSPELDVGEFAAVCTMLHSRGLQPCIKMACVFAIERSPWEPVTDDVLKPLQQSLRGGLEGLPHAARFQDDWRHAPMVRKMVCTMLCSVPAEALVHTMPAVAADARAVISYLFHCMTIAGEEGALLASAALIVAEALADIEPSYLRMMVEAGAIRQVSSMLRLRGGHHRNASNALLRRLQRVADEAAAEAAAALLEEEAQAERHAASKSTKAKKKKKCAGGAAGGAGGAPDDEMAADAAAGPHAPPAAASSAAGGSEEPSPAPPPAPVQAPSVADAVQQRIASPPPPVAAPPPPPSLPAAAPLHRAQPPPYRPPCGFCSPVAEPPGASTCASLLPLPTDGAAGAPPLPPLLAALFLNPPQPLPQAAAPVPPAPPPEAAAAPPPVVSAIRECCVCLADVHVADLLLLLPCAHRCVCAACAAALLGGAAPRCPKCREPVSRASRVFED